MIVLAHHHTQGVLGTHQRGGGFRMGQQIAADEPAFRHGAAIRIGHLPQPEKLEALVLPGGLERIDRAGNAHGGKFRVAGHIKGNVLKVAGQPHPGGQHDITAHRPRLLPGH